MEFEIDANLGSVPHLDQFFGLWALEETRLNGLFHAVRQMDMKSHLAQELSLNAASGDGRGASASPNRKNGLAIINLSGVLTKYGSSLSPNGSTLLARRALREAAADPATTGILFCIDSPGGVIAGVSDLSDEVTRINANTKPITVYGQDCLCSAAYWVASGSAKIIVNPTCAVGSIGCYGIVEDSSKAAEKNGIRVHVIRSAPFKGIGSPGTAIEEEQLAEFQRLVEEINSHFLSAVMAGRGMTAEQVKVISDGRTHIGARALALGLIDQVGNFEAAVALAHQQIELDNLSDNRETKKNNTAKAEFVPALNAEDAMVATMTEAADQHMKSIGA